MCKDSEKIQRSTNLKFGEVPKFKPIGESASAKLVVESDRVKARTALAVKLTCARPETIVFDIAEHSKSSVG